MEGRRLAWREAGTGRPVVLLHGFCEDSRIWQSFTPYLADAGFRVIAPDLPGFGHSEPFPQRSMADLAATIEQLIERLQLNRPVLIGHSMGGYTGLEILARQRIPLAGLSLFHAHPFADSEEKKALRQKSIDFLDRHGLAPYLRDFFPGLFPPAFVDAHPYIIRQLREQAQDYPVEGVQAALRAMADRRDHQKTLEEARVPIQFLLGLEDPLLPREKLLAQTYLPAVADIQLLPGVGHMGAQEAPDICVRHIAAFANFCQSFMPQRV